MTPIKQEILDRTFFIVEAAADKGERCPQSPPMGMLNSAALGALAREGRLRIEIFMHNYRVVTIMDGPHKGKQTLPPPAGKGSGRPYKIIYKDHILKRRQAEKQSGK